jgi:hypothetical protein
MALTPEILLINEQVLKKYTQLNEAVDTNLIRPAIYLAQDKYLVNYLGTDLTNKLKSDVDADAIAGAYETLLNEYVMKFLVWWTMIELYPTLVYKHDNGSIVIKTSEDTSSISESELNKMMDAASDNAKYYTQRMVDYLCANSASFPEYTSNQFPSQNPYHNVYTETGIVFSGGYRQNRLRWTINDVLPTK